MLRRASPSSLRTRLILLVLVAALPALALILYHDRELRRVAAARARDDVLRIVRVAAHDQERLIEQARQVLGVLARLPEVQARDGPRCSALLAGLRAYYSEHENFAVFTPRGDPFCSGRPAPGSVNASDRRFFQEVLGTRTFVVGDYTQSRITGSQVLVAAGPVFDGRGQLVGVIATGLSLDWLAGLARRVELPPGSSFSLIDASDTVVARHPDAERWVGTSVAHRADFRTMQARRGEQTDESRGLDGVLRIRAFKTVDVPGGQSRAYVTVGIPRAVVFAEADRVARRNLIALAGVIVIVVGLAWLGAEVLVLRPAGSLLRAVRRLGAGDLHARRGPPYGRGEIGEVGRAFDEMAESLERRTAETQALAGLGRTLAQSLDVAEVSRLTVESAASILGTSSVSVRLLEPDGTAVVMASGGVSREHFPAGLRLAPGLGLTARCLAEKKPVWARDLLQEPGLRFDDDQRRRIVAAHEHASLVVPLVARTKTIGVLTFAEQSPREFSDSEVVLGQQFADRAALALENARLYSETERRRLQTETLADVARSIATTLDLDSVLQRVTEGARRLCGSDLARIALRDPASGTVRVLYWAGPRASVGAPVIEPGKGLRGQVLLTGRPMRSDDYASDPRFGAEYRDRAQAVGTVAAMAVPIIIKERVEGVLYVLNRSRRPFTDGEEGVLMGLGGHAALAIENARLYERVHLSSERLGALSHRLLEVQEEERRRLARELHDEIGQALTAIKLNLLALERATVGGGPTAQVADSVTIVDRALAQVRDMSLALRPSLLDDLGLVSALRWYVRREAERSGLEVELALAEPASRPSPEVETASFRIVQEAVTNVTRYAQARRVSVGLCCEGGELLLTVADDGVGFDVARAREAARQGRSLGLLGMEERATLVGGRLEIESAPGKGTVIRARLPLMPTEPRT